MEQDRVESLYLYISSLPEMDNIEFDLSPAFPARSLESFKSSTIKEQDLLGKFPNQVFIICYFFFSQFLSF